MLIEEVCCEVAENFPRPFEFNWRWEPLGPEMGEYLILFSQMGMKLGLLVTNPTDFVKLCSFKSTFFDPSVGESSGRASRSLAKHIPGPSANIEALKNSAGSAASDIAKAHQLAVERGDKLSQLEERTQRMMNEAENFSSSAHSLMVKYKDKKWYQL